MEIDRIPALTRNGVNVIIETPKFSRIKYEFDPELKIMKYGKELPAGLSFPVDFGFIPQTLGGDGDPLDVLVLMNPPAVSGCVMECRVVGAILAKQSDKNTHFRNDRVLAVPATNPVYKNIKTIDDLQAYALTRLIHFLVYYNKEEGRTFTPIEKIGSLKAMRLVKKSIK